MSYHGATTGSSKGSSRAPAPVKKVPVPVSGPTRVPASTSGSSKTSSRAPAVVPGPMKVTFPSTTTSITKTTTSTTNYNYSLIKVPAPVSTKVTVPGPIKVQFPAITTTLTKMPVPAPRVPGSPGPFEFHFPEFLPEQLMRAPLRTDFRAPFRLPDLTAGSSKGSSRVPVISSSFQFKKKDPATETRPNNLNLNNDCKYFFGPDGCAMGGDCEYRHSEAAKGLWTMCEAWAQGNCEDWALCHRRHMDQKKLILQRRDFISNSNNGGGAKIQNLNGGGKRARFEEVIIVDEDSYDEEEDDEFDDEEVAEENYDEEEDEFDDEEVAEEENYDDEEDVEEEEEVDEEDAEEGVKNDEKNEAEGRTECPVCFGNKAEDKDLQFCAFIECGHITCEACASDLRKEKPAFCPLCRCKIVKRPLKIFLNN